MAETVVSFVLQQLTDLVFERVTLLTGVKEDLTKIRDELLSIQTLLRDADRRAADDEGEGANEGLKTLVRQLRETSFDIEDVIDEYAMYFEPKANHSGFVASFQNIAHTIQNLKSRYQTASKIHAIKLSIAGIKKRSERYEFKSEEEIGSGSSRGKKAARFGDPCFEEAAQVVGFESPRNDLVSYLMEGTNELMLVSVVGMGGLGKTTLVKNVFDNQLVKNHFDFRYFITVSQSYTTRDFLIDMISQFSMDSNDPIPVYIQEMDDRTLITHVRQYLRSKRYLLLFDDVWKQNFYDDDIQYALSSNNKGSRIIVTTRIMHVAEYFKEFFPIHYVHKLQPLSPNKACELFCNKAFRGPCPTHLQDVSNEILQKCGGLPLAIVSIAGFLSTKPKTMFEWTKVSQNLTMELERNVHLTTLTRILSLSYDDLPYHLKPCMLYFGIYPEDYTIDRKRLTRQWIAEGFVKNEDRRSFEEIAEGYLTELIQRNLVHVSKVGFDGKVKSCKVNGLLRDVIIRKMKDSSFCHLMHKYDEHDTIGITRRFSITSISNNVLRSTSNSNSGVRANFVFDKGELPKTFMDELPAKFKLLKVLDFEKSLLNSIPDNLGKLFHLRYLNLRETKVKVLPRSIGNLVNLETLDLRQTQVHQLPREINKLTKLRILAVYYKKYEGNCSTLNFTTGVKMQEGIGCLESLRKLYFLEADHGGIDLIRELKMLKQLRKLGLTRVRREFGSALCSAILKMKHLESLNIGVIDKEEILDLDFVSPPPNLRVLNLKCRMTKFPNWISKLKYLMKLRLALPNFEDDSLDTLKMLPNLLTLNLSDDAFSGESLHFQGGFPKLKELDLTRLNRLSSISIDKETLLGLEHLRFNNNPQLKVLPQDLQNLKNLRFLGFVDMPAELVDSIDPEVGGPFHWIINHIPLVQTRQNVGLKFHKYELHCIPTQSNA